MMNYLKGGENNVFTMEKTRKVPCY